MDRLNNWINCSIKLGKIDPFMVPILQGLGRLDIKLIGYEDEFLKLEPSKKETEEKIMDSIRLTESFTYSYLWVLGAYELIRTIDQRCREDSNLLGENLNNKFKELKHKFERIRIPLAKMEPARRHKDTDSRIAYPYIKVNSGNRISWRISEKEYIVRKELSDDFLGVLEEL